MYITISTYYLDESNMELGYRDVISLYRELDNAKEQIRRLADLQKSQSGMWEDADRSAETQIVLYGGPGSEEETMIYEVQELEVSEDEC